jgi:predicted membrane protein
MTGDDRRAGFSAHLVLGLVIIVVGVLFTLDNLDIVNGDAYLEVYWPAGLILIGLAKMFEAYQRGRSFLGGAFFAVVGTWLLLDNLRLISASFFDLWPLLLVAVGAVIVWQGLKGGGRRSHATAGDRDSVVSAVAVLSGVNRGSNSPNFRGGELTAFMGGCEIDLRQAGIDGEAVLDVFAMWGGIDIQVPEDWRVVSRVTPLLGGFDDQTRPPQQASSPTLLIRGVVIMGGIEIKN